MAKGAGVEFAGAQLFPSVDSGRFGGHGIESLGHEESKLQGRRVRSRGAPICATVRSRPCLHTGQISGSSATLTVGCRGNGDGGEVLGRAVFVGQEQSDALEFLPTVSVGKKAVVANAHEAAGEHMEKEPAKKPPPLDSGAPPFSSTAAFFVRSPRRRSSLCLRASSAALVRVGSVDQVRRERRVGAVQKEELDDLGSIGGRGEHQGGLASLRLPRIDRPCNNGSLLHLFGRDACLTNFLGR